MDILTALPQLTNLVQQAGVLGVLVLICVVLGWEVLRLRRQAVIIFKQRDRARLALSIVQSAADNAGAKYDLRRVDELLKDDAELAAA